LVSSEHALPHRNLLPLPHWSPRQPSLFLLSTRYQLRTDLGPVELWATHQRRPSAADARRSHGLERLPKKAAARLGVYQP
jgi:hypothetical protein